MADAVETLWQDVDQEPADELVGGQLEGLAAGDAEPKTIMIDATYLKAHRSKASTLLRSERQRR
jgi:hypothetical protein